MRLSKVITLLLALVVGTGAFAQGGKRKEMWNKVKAELNLTEQQEAQIKEIRKANKEEKKSYPKSFESCEERL